MKKNLLRLAVVSGMLITMSATVNAQWTRNAVTSKTYLTNTVDFLGIGTTNPNFKLDVQGTGITTMSFKSTTDNASILLDRGASNKSSSLTYRTAGVNNWQTGCVSNNNYTIRNNSLAQLTLHCDYLTNNVGIGTNTPAAKLDVAGDALINGVKVGKGNNAIFYNTALGANTLDANSNGSYNTATGFQVLKSNTSGNFNTASGFNSQMNTTTGNANSSLGYMSLSFNTDGYYNTGVGAWSMRLNTSGFQNTGCGYGALYGITTGSFNTALGSGADVSAGNLVNATAIGANAVVSQDSSLVLGNAAKVGIGTSAPTAQLHTTGTVRHEGLSGGGNRMVFADSLGNLLTGPQLISTSVNTNNNSISFPGQDGSGICVYDSSNIIISGLPNLVNSSSISLRITGSSALWIWLKAPNGELLGIINGSPPRLFSYNNDLFSDTAAFTYPYNYGPPSEKIGNSWVPDGSVTGYCYNSIDPVVGTFGALGGGTINPNGVWTLYVAENGLGGNPHLSDWSVNISDVSGLGINNFVAKWEAGNLTSSSNIYDNGTNVGIGTTTPDAKLVVVGTMKIADGTQGAGKMLTSDANGFASWTTPAPFAKSGDTWTEEQQKEVEAKDDAIKSLQSTVGNLQNVIVDMQQCIESLCNNAAASKVGTTIDSPFGGQGALFQNSPNPFNQTTVIRYALSSEANSGRIIIRDLNGNLVKQVSIAQSGKGQVTINANELAQGTYTYTLEIAGVSVDTKLMVVTK